MIDVLTPKRIYPDCPFKATRGKQNLLFWLLGVQFDLAVWCTPRRLTPRYDAHHGDWLCVVMYTTEFDSALWWTPRRLTQCCDAHHGDWLSVVLHTTEFDLAVWCAPRGLTWLCDAHHGDWLCIAMRCDALHGDWLDSVMHTVEMISGGIYCEENLKKNISTK